jgi:5-methylthioadenosine/S-adenosylhomocysteine deaminase
MRTLIKNVHILTMDDQMTEYKNGYVLIEENRIIDLGEWREGLVSSEKVIDGENGLLLPGFVNTHTCGDDSFSFIRR